MCGPWVMASLSDRCLFEIRTDHKTLVWLQTMKNNNAKLLRCVMKLSEFDFSIQHVPGEDNPVTDALSRLPLQVSTVRFSCAMTMEDGSCLPSYSRWSTQRTDSTFAIRIITSLQGSLESAAARTQDANTPANERKKSHHQAPSPAPQSYRRFPQPRTIWSVICRRNSTGLEKQMTW